MKVTPLLREVRHVRNLGRDVVRYQNLSRWALLILVYFVIVMLCLPRYSIQRESANPKAMRLAEAEKRGVALITFEDPVQPSRLYSSVPLPKVPFGYNPDAERVALERLRTVYIQTANRVDITTTTLADDASTKWREELRRHLPESLQPVGSVPLVGEPSRIQLTMNVPFPAEDVLERTELLRNPYFQTLLEECVRELTNRKYLLADEPLLRQYVGLFNSRRLMLDESWAEFDDIMREERMIRTRMTSLPESSREYVLVSRLVRDMISDPRFQGLDGIVARKLGIIAVYTSLEPNGLINEQERERLAQDHDRSVEERKRQTRLIRAGESLIRPEYNAAEQESILKAHRETYELRTSRFENFIASASHFIYVLIIFGIISFFIRKFSLQIRFNTYNVALISLPIVLALTLMAIVLSIGGGQLEYVGHMFPAGMIGMLGVILLDVRMALLLVTWGCLLFGLQVNFEFDYVIVALFGGYTGVAALYTIRQRYEVFIASLLIGITQAAVILLKAIVRDPGADIPVAYAVVGFASGISSFLVLAILPLIERFGIVTDMQLLELTGIHQPLLRKLEEEAPGTWQHTLNVAKLAEAAATEIGVNYLLIRAGCYYHDIGKMSKPEYFTENQITPEDKMRHSELKPIMSALVIKNHVKEGLEMAREANLPPRIIDFIEQHHGTCIISFFYHKALEGQARGDSKEQVRIDDYRYPFRKPQSIEAAIVMLADSVEATATAKLSNKVVREDDIEQVVRTIVFEKFNDGQFDECNLTLQDLNVIRETFVHVLKSRFHTRIDYPKGDRPQAKPSGGSASATSTPMIQPPKISASS